jgi:hypothetical protein
MNAATRARALAEVKAHKAFFADALSESEQLELAEAYAMEGLEGEIATLRVRLKTALREHPEDYALMLAGMGMLVKAVGTQYRVSPKARTDLADNFVAVLNSIGDQLMPPGEG